MLSARAYSFRQKSRLAISLSWIGGYVNVVAFLASASVASHVTGNVTHLGRTFAEGDYAETIFMTFMWVTFFLGAVSSAVLTEVARRQSIASKYIPPMAFEAALLTLLAILLGRHHGTVAEMPKSLLYCIAGVAAFAMGLQNATITKISGAVIRTTHLTGVTTDLGIELVQYIIWLRDVVRGRKWSRAGRALRVSNRHPSFLRVLLLASIVGSFLFGATVGTFIYHRWPGLCLMAPVAFLGWIIGIDFFKPIADVKELDLMADSELRLLGIVKSLLPPDLGIWRISCRQKGKWHQAPDFLPWVERIPARWRVIVLALSPLTRFDANAVLDLESALKKLESQHRKLILSGITPGQYRNLMDLGLSRSMEVENLCPDLEFAVARGIDLLQTMHPEENLFGDVTPPSSTPIPRTA